jgi:hypothetical protein
MHSWAWAKPAPSFAPVSGIICVPGSPSPSASPSLSSQPLSACAVDHRNYLEFCPCNFVTYSFTRLPWAGITMDSVR